LKKSKETIVNGPNKVIGPATGLKCLMISICYCSTDDFSAVFFYNRSLHY